MEDTTRRDLFVALISATLSGLISWQICRVSLQESSEQAAAALKASKDNADADALLTVQMDELQEWRKRPNIERLQSQTIDGQTLQTTLQNIGGRHAVLWGVQYNIAPKMGGDAGGKASLTVDTGVQAKTCKLDLRNFDLMQTYDFSPPITIPPGEVLTLQIKLPMETPSGFVHVYWNAENIQVPGSPRSPIDVGYFTSNVNPFRR